MKQHPAPGLIGRAALPAIRRSRRRRLTIAAGFPRCAGSIRIGAFAPPDAHLRRGNETQSIRTGNLLKYKKKNTLKNTCPGWCFGVL